MTPKPPKDKEKPPGDRETSPLGRTFRVTGRVQGVGFRWWTVHTALQLDLVGTVENLPDGSVEIRAGGRAVALEEFREQLWHGPPAARVQTIEEMSSSVSPSSGFRIVT